MAGLTAKLQGSEVTLGRHPESRLQFHPALDLEVSARHAVIVHAGERWLVRDLASRNGTYVNGRRITADALLRDGDRITLGRSGPVIEFHLAGLPPEASGAWSGTGGREAETPHKPKSRPRHDAGSGATVAARRNRRLRWLSCIMAAILVAVTVIYTLGERKQRTAWESERLGMERRMDSLLLASEASTSMLEGMLDGLTAALRQSHNEIQQIGDQLRTAETAGDRTQILALRRRFETATLTLDRQKIVAALDFRGVERRNRRAVAKVYVEYDNGEVATATAFAVRPDATLLTSRHVVTGSDGRRWLRRMVIQFSDSDRIWPARVLAVANDADLAVVKVDDIVGRVPVVQTLNLRSDTVATGAPVALIGFPLGGEPVVMNDRAASIARPLLSAGVISLRQEDRFELQGYGAAGASGSPVFDANGEVIAVLFGGRRDANGKLMLESIPVVSAIRLLESTP
jgi:S1-C subfamily serine protease